LGATGENSEVQRRDQRIYSSNPREENRDQVLGEREKCKLLFFFLYLHP
jgi:hypothetical protein